MIVKVTAPNSVPTDISDYQAQNAHMMAFMNQVNMQAFILTNPTVLSKPKIAQGTYISHGGSLYKVDSTDEDISGSPSDGKVYIRVTGDATLSASFITDISGYTYNHAYGALTNGNYTLLPYEIRKSGSDWLKYRYDVLGGRHLLDQNLRTTDSPTFATVNTGHGANELYPMNQGVRTTDSPTFSALSFASLNPGNSTETSIELSAGASQVLPKGAYAISSLVGLLDLEMKHGSEWIDIFGGDSGGFVISDGVNFRLINNASITRTAKMRKW